MDAYNGSLYVFSEVTTGRKLLRYSYDGELLEEISHPRGTYFMTIHNGILYSSRIYSYLSRFDLTSKTFLSDIYSPAVQTSGIRIVDDFLYYCDDFKWIVGRVPIEDIE